MNPFEVRVHYSTSWCVNSVQSYLVCFKSLYGLSSSWIKGCTCISVWSCLVLLSNDSVSVLSDKYTVTVPLRMQRSSTLMYVRIEYPYVCKDRVPLCMQRSSTLTYAKIEYPYVCKDRVPLRMKRSSTLMYAKIEYPYVCKDRVPLRMKRSSSPMYAKIEYPYVCKDLWNVCRNTRSHTRINTT